MTSHPSAASNSNSNPNQGTATPILILDGGLGTSLEDKYNASFSTDTPLWSSHLLLSPSEEGLRVLRKCQSDFALAGADIILTATYQASLEGFKASGVTDTHKIATEYLPEAIRSAADAVALTEHADDDNNEPAERGRKTGRVALSIGPYGATMIPSTEYSGLYDDAHRSVDNLTEWHTERIETLYAPLGDIAGLLDSVGYIAFETIPRVNEILAVRRAMDRVKLISPNSRLASLPVWISCVFPRDDNRLPDGTSVEEVIAAMLNRAGADWDIKMVPWGIGINCTKVGKLPMLVQQYEEAIRRAVERGDVDEWPSLVLYPDGTNGEVYNTETKEWEVPRGVKVPRTPWEKQVADVVKSTAKTGQWRSIIVGGCCKTTDKDIAELRATVLGKLSDTAFLYQGSTAMEVAP
ncbi:Homocysteine S-methyltransferase [Naviculisporaceae sp. PSN 640]